MHTAFSEHEAEYISDLGWYKDSVLQQLICDNFANHSLINKNSTILDIGCGVGLMCNPLSKVFSKYIGVDNSRHMIRRAWQRNDNDKTVTFNDKTVTFIEGDIIECLKNKSLMEPVTHVLIKNVLQFLDVGLLLSGLKKAFPNGFVGQIIQTTRKDNQPDLFRLLNCLDFVKRVKTFYTSEEIIGNLLGNGYEIINVNSKYSQTILLDDWLKYHGVSNKQCYDTYKALGKLSNSKLNEYNIVEENELLLTRKLTIIFFRI